MKRFAVQMIFCAIFFSLCLADLAAQEKKNPWAFDANPDLPNVLILGDSISEGYTLPVRELLQGKANVYRPMNANGTGPENCGNTKIGLKNIDRWLDTKRINGKNWDVIHFNWGLWDLSYRYPPNQDNTGVRGKEKGGISFTPEQYGENLEKLVVRLEKTGAKLIWGSISLVPEGEEARVVGDDVKFNAVAAEIMKKHGIPINDIHALTAKFEPELFQGPGNVHFKPAGSKKIAEQVAEQINAVGHFQKK